MKLFDKDGNPITTAQYATLEYATLVEDRAYSRVRRSSVFSATDPTVTFDVSTVWLGVDHSSGDGPPLIFETMVFAEGSTMDGDRRRYSTLAEAEAGHAEMVAAVAATVADAVVNDTEAGAQ